MSNTDFSLSSAGDVPEQSIEQLLALAKDDNKYLRATIDDLKARCERTEAQLAASMKRNEDSQIIIADFVSAIGKITVRAPSTAAEADEIFLSMSAALVSLVDTTSPGDADIATAIDNVFYKVIDYVNNGLNTVRLLIDKPGFIRSLLKLVNSCIERLHEKGLSAVYFIIELDLPDVWISLLCNGLLDCALDVLRDHRSSILKIRLVRGLIFLCIESHR
jgi:hypothetical protein